MLAIVVNLHFESIGKLQSLLKSIAGPMAIYTDLEAFYQADLGIPIKKPIELYSDKPNKLLVVYDKTYNSRSEDYLENLVREFISSANNYTKVIQLSLDCDILYSLNSTNNLTLLSNRLASENFSNTSLSIALGEVITYPNAMCYLLTNKTTSEELDSLIAIAEASKLRLLDIIVDLSTYNNLSVLERLKNAKLMRVIECRDTKKMYLTAKKYAVGIHIDLSYKNDDVVPSEFYKLLLLGLVVFTNCSFSKLPEPFYDLSKAERYLHNTPSHKLLMDLLTLQKLFLFGDFTYEIGAL